jgi:small subunit ribosomal protein S20
MPIIKSAKKKLRGDIKKTRNNQKYIRLYKKTLKDFFKKKTAKREQLKKVYSILDKAVKKNIIHKNKASRLKSRAAKLIKK